MVLDLVIVGATVVDGTGSAPRPADVGVVAGRVAFVDAKGVESAEARHRIDGRGLTLAPGFVDVHTHFDAQLFWDAAFTPSSLHGVTTVFGGNCGFSIAPLGDDSDYMVRLLSRVEGIPLAALRTGVPWTWRSFAEYLDAVETNGVAVNFGALVGHSALRRAVLGARSGDAVITDDELTAMRRLLADALTAGAIGFSSSWASTHLDGDGNPVPSRAASAAELVDLCRTLADYHGRQVEFIPTNGQYDEAHIEVMTEMASAARSPLNWNILVPRDRAWTANRLRACDVARSRGASVVGLSYPDVIRGRTSFLSSSFDSIPGWGPTMALPPAEKLAALVDPDRRAVMRAGAASPEGLTRPAARYEALTVGQTYHLSNRPYQGRTIAQIAAETGRDPLDVLCDIVVADELRTGLVPQPIAADAAAWASRVETWSDPRVVIGASDAGAHLDMLSTFDYPVRFLALTRDREALPLPEAVHRLTAVPARLYGLLDRGRVAPGCWADLVLFDAATVGPGPVEWRDDLPSGAGRLYAEPVGIAHVIVNGTEIVRGGEITGALPGRVLRGGRDTEDGTVPSHSGV